MVMHFNPESGIFVRRDWGVGNYWVSGGNRTMMKMVVVAVLASCSSLRPCAASPESDKTVELLQKAQMELSEARDTDPKWRAQELIAKAVTKLQGGNEGSATTSETEQAVPELPPPVAVAPKLFQPAPSATLSHLINDKLGKILAPIGGPGYKHPEVIEQAEDGFENSLEQSPPVAKAAYYEAIQVCEALLDAVEAREASAEGLAVSRTIRAGSSLGFSFKDNPGWRELIKELREQRKLNKQARQTDAFFNAAHRAEWLTQAGQYREKIFQLYRQECEVERECTASAETSDSQNRAVYKYPELGKLNSQLNQEFRRHYAVLKASGDSILQDPDWPEKLAKQCSDGLTQASAAR